MNLRLPSVTFSTHTSAFKAVAFQSPAMPNARMSLWMQSVHSFSFPPRPLRTAPSRFPKTIRFGSRPPLIRRSVSAHRSLLVRNVVSMLSHPVISRARLYEVIRWFGILRCAPIIRSKTRWCTVWTSRARLPILHVVSWIRKMDISLSAVAPENLVSRDGFGSPVARQPAHLHTQAESGAYLRDSFRVPRRRPFIYFKTTTRHWVSPEFIGSCIMRTNGVHCREFVGTGPVSLKVVPNECCLGRSPWTNK